MNKAAPWSIKGVDFDTREAAREAAQRAGMPLGDWLNQIIAEQAEGLGVKVEEIDRDTRLEAVKERLTQLARMSEDEASEAELSAGMRRSDRSGPSRSSSQAADEETAEEADARYWRRQSRPSPTRSEPREASFFGRAPRRAAEDAAHEDTDTALNQVARRLAGIERQLDERSLDESETPVKAAISRLERRIETLAERAEDPGIMDETLHHFDRKLNAIARKLDQPAAKTAAERGADMARIEAKLNTLMANLDRSPRARQSAREQMAREQAPAEAPRREPLRPSAPLPTPRSIDHAISEILQRQRNLDEDAFVAEAPSADMAALKTDIATLSSRVEDMRREVIERDARDVLERRTADLKPREPSPELQSLRRQVGEMSLMLAGLAPRDSVAAVETAVRDLGQRIETSRQGGVGASLLAPIEQHFADLHHAMQVLAPTATIDRISQEISGLAGRIDTLSASSLPPQELELIRRQTQETRDLLAKAISHPLPIESIEKQIGALNNRIDTLATLAPSPAFTQSLARSLDEIRVALSRPAPVPSFEPLENRIEALTRKFDDALANDDTGTKFDALAGRLDEFHRSLAAHIAEPPPAPRIDTEAFENSLRDLGEKLDKSNFQSALEPLEDRIEQLARKLDGVISDDSTSGKFDALAGRIEEVHRSLATRLTQAQAAAPPARIDTDRLEALVGELAQKVENARAPQADSQALEALQSQIEKVVQRLDRSDSDVDAIGSLERTIGDLFAQLEETQGAAEAAARDAARDAVREAMREVPANSPTSDSISLELADLRALQDTADRRTHATLTAVHETLEKVVDRLAMLEDEITEVRPAESRGSVAAQAPGGPGGLGKAAPLAANEALRAAAPAVEAKRASGRVEPDVLIEPGSGLPPARRSGDQPSKTTAAASAAEAASAQANFIAAARRAAQAATAEAKTSNPGQRITATASIDEAFAEARARAKAAAASLLGGDTDDVRPNAVGQALSFVAARKRPILLSLAGLVILIGALQVVRRAGDEVAPPVLQQPAQSDKTSDVPAAATPAAAQPTDPKPADAKPAVTDPAPTPPAATPNSRDGASLGTPTLLNKAAQLLQATPFSSSNPMVQAAIGAAQNFTGGASAAADHAPVGSITPPAVTAAASPPPALVMAMPPTGIVGTLRGAAGAGDPAAQYLVGVAYADGRDIARDYGVAAQWLGKAAAQNLAPAQYRLASLYEKGLGVLRDDALAKVWYQRAADQGNVRAMHNLAVLSAEGADGKPDYASAARWFIKAANFGVRDSQFNLAILYARGLGTDQSLSQSYAWFAIAAAQGDDDAAKKRDDVGAKLSSDQMAAAKAQIAAFTPQTPDPAANDVAMPSPGKIAPKTQASAAPIQTHL